jgi:Integrase core domain
MTHLMHLIRHLGQFISMLLMLLAEGAWYIGLCLRSPTALAAENLFLRKQLSLCRERSITPRRATPATRLTLVWLARWFDWRRALVIVQPATLRVLKTPPWTPQANAICERVLGTLRRECLDYMIPLTEHHLRRLLHEWVQHYNIGRPHMALGPGIPQPASSLRAPLHTHRHRLRKHLRVVARPVLGGLHQEYWLKEQAA